MKAADKTPSQPTHPSWGQERLQKAHSYLHAAMSLKGGSSHTSLPPSLPRALVQYKRGFVHAAVLKPHVFLFQDTSEPHESRRAGFIHNLRDNLFE